MVTRLTDWVLTRLVGGTTAQACLCQPYCWSQGCVYYPSCSSYQAQQVRCQRCDCSRYSRITSCC